MKINGTKIAIVITVAFALATGPGVALLHRHSKDLTIERSREAAAHQEAASKQAEKNDTLRREANLQPIKPTTSDGTKVVVKDNAVVPIGFTTADQAVASAKAAFPGKTTEKVEVVLADEDITVYEVHFTDDSRVEVRAADGLVTEVEEAKDTDSGSDDSKPSGDTDPKAADNTPDASPDSSQSTGGN